MATVTNPNTSSVREVALARALKILNSVGVDYAVRALDGEFVIQGDIQITTPKVRTRSPSKLPHGTIKNHIESFGLSSLNIGEVCRISVDGIDAPLETLRSSACARANAMWGQQSVITSIDKENGYVEVLRLI